MSATPSSIKDKNNAAANFKAFGMGLLGQIVSIALIVTLGVAGLYTCKVAQANILPDFKVPLDVSRQVEKININALVIKEYDWFGLAWLLFGSPTRIASQKITFDNAEVQRDFYKGIAGQLMSRRENGNYWYFFSNVLNTLIEFNGTLVNHAFPPMHANLPEWTIVLLYACMFPFLVIGQGFVNMFATAGTFASRTWVGDLTKPVAEGASGGVFGYSVRLMWAFALFWVCLVPMGVLWAFTTAYAFLAPLTISYRVANTTKTFWSFLGEFFVYKQFFLVAMTWGVIQQVNKNLGGVYTASAGIAVLAAIFMGIYRAKVPENAGFTDGLVSYAQAHAKKGRIIALDVVRDLLG